MESPGRDCLNDPICGLHPRETARKQDRNVLSHTQDIEGAFRGGGRRLAVIYAKQGGANASLRDHIGEQRHTQGSTMNGNLAFRLPIVRHPHESECTWSDSGKCLHSRCRYSLLGERRQFDSWSSEDQAELCDALPDTCALTLAESGAQSLEEIALLLGMSREAVERTEAIALRRLSLSRDLRRARWDSR